MSFEIRISQSAIRNYFALALLTVAPVAGATGPRFRLCIVQHGADEVSFQIATNRSQYLQYENIYIRASIKNIGSRKIEVMKPLFYWFIRDISGDTLLRPMEVDYPTILTDYPLAVGESLLVEKELRCLFPRGLRPGEYEIFAIQGFPNLEVKGLLQNDLAMMEKSSHSLNIFPAIKPYAHEMLMTNKVVIRVDTPSGDEKEALRLLFAGKVKDVKYLKERPLTYYDNTPEEKEAWELIKNTKIFGEKALRELIRKKPKSRYAKQAQMEIAQSTLDVDKAKKEYLNVLSYYAATRYDSMEIYQEISERMQKAGRSKEAQEWLLKRPQLTSK